jgi:hypothetical protein
MIVLRLQIYKKFLIKLFGEEKQGRHKSMFSSYLLMIFILSIRLLSIAMIVSR